MINIQNLSYKYKNSGNILNNINLRINDGEIVAIVGENGSGKSTLAKVIAGILKVKTGQITIDGIDIKKNKDGLKNVGIVFQNPENQIIFSRIEDEFKFTLNNLGKEENKKIILDALEKVSMSDFLDKDLYELSLGQKQRVVIAEALAKKPKYIVFDEPTTMIDSIGKDNIRKIIKDLKKEGYTIIYITNLSEEILIADRVLILENGTICEDINKKELLEKYEVLTGHNIKLPIIIEIAKELNIDLKEYTTEELIDRLKVMRK